MGKPKKKLSYRAKYKLLMGGSFLTTITPLLIVILINREAYFTRQYKVIMNWGLMIALVFVIIAIACKLKITKLLWISIFVGIAIFFENVFKDIKMLSIALWIGAVLDRIIFDAKVKRYAKLADYQDQANVNSDKQKEINKELVNDLKEAITDAIRSGRA